MGECVCVSMRTKACKQRIFEGTILTDLRKRCNLYSGRDDSGARQHSGDVYRGYGVGGGSGVRDRLCDGTAVPRTVLGLHR